MSTTELVLGSWIICWAIAASWLLWIEITMPPSYSMAVGKAVAIICLSIPLAPLYAVVAIFAGIFVAGRWVSKRTFWQKEIALPKELKKLPANHKPYLWMEQD
jgi:membrane protein implicated in regulation of membrane protease activity